MKGYLLAVLLLWFKLAFGQLDENFSDGNFTGNPTWSGSNSSNDFTVISGQLRSNSLTASSNFYLSTTNTLANSCIWEFTCNLQFNPSGLNYADIYLISDQSDLQSNNINGYFVRIGNTDDEISLYKRTGAKSTSIKIIDGVNAALNTTNNTVKVRVTRTAGNMFTLERDLTGTGSSYFSEGSVTDSEHIISARFGIYIQQSVSSFFQKHFFDDIKITPIVTDSAAPELLSARAIDSLTVETVFNEPLDSTLAKNRLNYLISELGNPQSVSLISSSIFRLHYSSGIPTGSYSLTVSNIKDISGNIIADNSSAPFSFIKPYQAKKNDIAINEIFADPSPQIDLPALEFIELWNTTDKLIRLNNWRYGDPAATYTFTNDSLMAGEYVILCAKADTSEFKRFGRVIGVSPWPSLNNSGDVIKLVSDKNSTISEVSYADSWYKDAAKKQGGYSLERIDALSKCEGLYNWIASADISGGTPGRMNSVYQSGFDLVQLKADSVNHNSDTTVKVYFNKPLDLSTLTSDKFVLSPSLTTKTIMLNTDGKEVTIIYSQKLSGGTEFTLSIQGLKDCGGNQITALNQPLTFRTASTPPARADTARIFITEIFADPSPEVGMPLAEFVEIYNPGRDTIDLAGWSLSDATTKSILQNAFILPGTQLILCPAADTTQYKAFGKVVGLSPWPSFGNTSDQVVLKSFKDRTVDSVAYTDTWYKSSAKKSGGWSLERIDPLSRCSGSSAWSASLDPSGGTPGKINSIYQKDYDLLAFHADSLKKTTDSTVTVYFNKVIDHATVSNEKFTLAPASGSVKSAVVNAALNQVSLTFSRMFSPGIVYSLSVQAVDDCAGNVLSGNTTFTFSTPALPPVKPARPDTVRIFITEIFADPSPEVGLPLAEFVEIYNPGRDTIDLTGWSLSDATTKTILQNAFILPGKQLILCPAADTAQYLAFGKVVGLSPWPALGNTSDKVILKSFKGRTVDSVAYDDNWYKSTAKKNGGWSLERIDPLSRCAGLSVWSASEDPSGGTPGKINSIYQKDYDLLAFRADSLKMTTDSTVTVYFNKVIDQATVSNEKFTLAPASGSVKSAVVNAALNQVSLTFSRMFSPGTDYSLSVQAVDDCAGNVLSGNTTFTFSTQALPPVKPVRADTATLFITEIFADPSPEVALPLTEFVEIYNPGKDTIDLAGWSLSDATTKTILQNAFILPGKQLILCPAADTAQYLAFGKVVGLSPWPALGNTSDKTILKSFKGRTVDSVAYDDSWYKSTAKENGGWSLERIDPLSRCSGLSAWSASLDPSGGTPGKINSIYQKDYDLLAFHADSLKKTTDSTVTVYFNKVINQASMAPEKFVLSPSSGVVKSAVLNPGLSQVLLTFSQRFSPATNYLLSVQGIEDCSGKVASGNTTFTFSTPALPPVKPARPDTARIFITEIFADPSPEVGLPLTEFVEIYNPGKDTIDLTGWSLSDATTKTILQNAFILPGKQLILCPAADTAQYLAFGKVVGLSPWPALGNTSDKIILKSFKGRTVDSVAYDDSWYKSTAKKNGGWSLERIDVSIPGGWYTWGASSDFSGGTPGRINSNNKPDVKNTALKIDSVIVISDSMIRIYFNVVQDTSFLKASNFTINGQTAKFLKSHDNYLVFDLEFNGKFTEGVTYTLISSGLKTPSGVLISEPDNQKTFSIPVVPILSYPIIINEIFADSSPIIGLPDAEFIELVNLSDRPAALRGLMLEDGTSRYIFPSGMIEPGGYLILCAAKDTLSFKPFGNVHGLNPWPGLNNDKETLKLRNNKNAEFQRVEYQADWHNSKEKQAGGWSLELVNPNAVCSGRQNWASSTDISGGTPGKPNSVFNTGANIDPLILSACTLIDSMTAVLTFSRPVDSVSANSASRYRVNNGLGTPGLASPVGPEFTKVVLTYPQQIARGSTYTITVDSITDCAGNLISSAGRSAEFFFPKAISKADIIINEILFNPRKGGVDFLEIYNNSSNELDLKDLSIATIKDTLTSLKPVTAFSQLFKPGEYKVLSTDPDKIKREYITQNPDAFLKVPSMPSFSDDIGMAVLVSNGTRVDEFAYSEKMHYKLIKNPEGVSLERSSFKKPANEPGNFRSAAATVGYATPGYKNSQFVEDAGAGDDEVFLSSKTVSPDNDGFEDVLQLNYNLKEAGWVASISVYNDRGVLVKKMARNLSLAVNGTLYWDGLTEADKRASVGIYVLFIEMFNSAGHVKKYKRSFVVAEKLD